jgi:hypothetical protein
LVDRFYFAAFDTLTPDYKLHSMRWINLLWMAVPGYNANKAGGDSVSAELFAVHVSTA